MKITQCKYGHYYDKAYFAKCPHCYRKNGGRDEDIIIKDVKLTANLSDTNQITKTQDKKESDRENVKRWTGEAWDELEEILADEESEPEEKERQQHKKKNESYKIGELLTGNAESYMLFAAMPLKVIKNQEFCMDFCLFPEKEWETGAKMLAFKSQESIRDLKPVQMILPAAAVLHILYKEEEIFCKEIEISTEKKNEFFTFPVTVTDTRDRRFHMVKVVFEVKEQNIEIPLYLMPNP